jgi:tetratricopeptide (TPR) repeat protein
MTRKIFIILFIIFCVKLAEAQQTYINNFDAHIEKVISLSEKALYKAEFGDALQFVECAYFEKFSAYESKHKIWLTIQNIRVQSFQARLYQLSFNSEEHLSNLLDLLPQVEIISDELIKAKYFTLLSALYGSKNLELCILYENKALDIFKNQADYKSIAELQATQISRELARFFRDNKKEEAIALIPRFREEIDFSTKHSKYALAYNTRHLANIYRIYEIDQREALNLYEQSLALREEIGFQPFIPASYYSLGEVYSNLGMHESAIKAYNKSFELAEKVHFIRYMIIPIIKLGDIYAAIGDNAKAKEFYVKAIKFASQNSYNDKGIGQIIEKIIAIEK